MRSDHPSVILLNDTSSSKHFGCELVVDALKKHLPIPLSIDMKDDWKKHEAELEKASLIVVNGEGSLHHGRRVELVEVAEKYPSVLINAVWQEMPPSLDLSPFKMVSVRESYSFREAEKHGAKPRLVPDLIFSHEMERAPERLGTILVNSVDRGCGLRPHVPGALDNILSAETLVSGRFHATAVAMIAQIPFTAYGTNTWKTEAMLHDAGLSHLYSDQIEEAEGLRPGICSILWVAEARAKVLRLFADINEMIEIGK